MDSETPAIRFVTNDPEPISAAASSPADIASPPPSTQADSPGGYELRPSRSHPGLSRQRVHYDYAGLSLSQRRALASHQQHDDFAPPPPPQQQSSSLPPRSQTLPTLAQPKRPSTADRGAYPPPRSPRWTYSVPAPNLGGHEPDPDEVDHIQYNRLAAAAEAAASAAAAAAASAAAAGAASPSRPASPRPKLAPIVTPVSAATPPAGPDFSTSHDLCSPTSHHSVSSNEALERWPASSSSVETTPASTSTSASDNSEHRSWTPEVGAVSLQHQHQQIPLGTRLINAAITTKRPPQLDHRMGEHWEPMTAVTMASNPQPVEPPLKPASVVASGRAPVAAAGMSSRSASYEQQYDHDSLARARQHQQQEQQRHYQQPNYSQPQLRQPELQPASPYTYQAQGGQQQYYAHAGSSPYSHPSRNGSSSAGPSSSSASVNRSYSSEHMSSAAAILAAGPQPLPSPAVEYEHQPGLPRTTSQQQDLANAGPSGSSGAGAAAASGGVHRSASTTSHPVSFAPSTKLQQMHPVRMLKQQQAAQAQAAQQQQQASYDGPLYGPMGLQSRVFGLSKDLRYPSPESAHLPPSSGGLAGVTASGNPKLSPPPPGTDAEALATFGMRAGGNGSSASLNSSKAIGKAGNGQRFSVEVFAPSFDKRGYPVIAGRAATIKGVVRMPAQEGCDVVLQVSAHTTQGAPAAVWQGVALMPPDSGTDRKIFDVKDLLQPDQGNVRPRPAPPGEEPSTSFPFSDDFVLDMPFEVQLPLGMSTRFVNGEVQKVAVPLPPSYEMSTQADREERESQRANSTNFLKSSGASVKSKMGMSVASGMTGVSQNVKDALGKGFGEAYRLGCFYSMSVTLIRRHDENSTPDQSSKSKKKGKKISGPLPEDMLSIPFVFLGEPTPLPMPPSGIPPFVSPDVLLEPGRTLGPDWEVHCESTRWAGSMLKTTKRNVDLELHMPSPSVLQAPCMWPMLLIIRPADPRLLPSRPSSAHGTSPTGTERVLSWDQSAGGSPTIGSVASSPHLGMARLGNTPNRYSPGEELSRQLGEIAERKAAAGQQDDGGTREELQPPPAAESTSTSLVSKIRTSLSISRKSSNMGLNASQSASALQQHHNTSSGAATTGNAQSSASTSGTPRRSRASLASTFGRRRPSTAPSGSGGSGASPAQSTVMGYTRDRDPSDLARLVRIALLQTTHCISTGPSDLPKSRRKLVSLADLEEVDIGHLLGVPSSPPPALDGSDGGAIPEDHEPASIVAARAVADHVRSLGIRVLRASIKVARDQVPAFRCQGIEVKYAIKVDLLPFSSASKQPKRPASGGTTAGNSSGGSTMSDALRTVPSAATLASSNAGSGRRSLSSTFRRSRHQSNASATASMYASSEHARMPSNTSELPRTPPLPLQHAGGGSGAPSIVSDGATLYRSPSQTSPSGANLSFAAAIGGGPANGGAGGMGSIPSPVGPPSALSYGNLRNHHQGSDTRSLYGVAGAPTTTGGTTVYAGEESGKKEKVSKTVGALWVDVRIVRSSLA